MSATKSNLVLPVILCGGSGTRLWPLSRTGLPKQFLALYEDSSCQTLFQQAISRINAIGNPKIELGKTLIVSNEEHRFLILDQLRELREVEATLLLEPVGRNTAPALTLAALNALGDFADLGDMHKEMNESLMGNIDPILVITPADQAIQNQVDFVKSLQDCISVVGEGSQVIAVLGIKPTGPETGYGYIKHSSLKGQHNAFSIEKFVEKPDTKIAQAYVEHGGYLWNAGIFVMRASTWLAALKEFQPDLLEMAQKSWRGRTIDSYDTTEIIRPSKDDFVSISSDSIDYAVIEKCPNSLFALRVVELNAGWSDLGSWEAVWQVKLKDEENNVLVGDSILSESKNCLVYSTNRLVSGVGLENIVIIETPDAILVADKSKTQNVRDVVAKLDLKKQALKNLHRKVPRPWGWYDSLDQGENFKVKRIQVRPGASLSLQKHNFRAEHWVVVKGIAEITNGNQTLVLKENQSTYIPKGEIHRLTNPGDGPLEIIEVQSGEYLGEDDIVRIEDQYGRG